MKLAFLDDSKLDYTPQTPFDRPLGGTQSAAAYLTAALAARGHEVALINSSSETGRIHGVDVPGRNAGRVSVVNKFDALIVLTRPTGRGFRNGGVTVPMISWQHKSIEAGEIRPFALAEERAAWDAVAFVSDHQRLGFKEKFGIDGVVMRNAASPASLVQPFERFLDRREDPTLIYASAPGRGLDILLFAFALIRESLPEAKLKICSDQGIYQAGGAKDDYAAFYAMARTMPGVEFIGAVSQTDLAAQFARSDILAYPTNFLETSCIVAMEAAASGCLFAAADYGPLRETLAGFGVFIPLAAFRGKLSRDFASLIIDTVGAARADPDAYRRRRLEQSQWFRATHSWDARAQAWEAWLTDLLARPRVVRSPRA